MMIMGLAWAYLIIACILEPIWVIFLEKSDNFKNKGWGFATIIAVLLCLYMLSLAVKEGCIQHIGWDWCDRNCTGRISHL